MLLKELGQLRIQRERARGGVSLPLPEQEIRTENGRWDLNYRELLWVEEWNAQMSLLTGFAAASLMIYARVGLLRTLPPIDPRDLRRLHRTAHALGIDWPAELLFPDFIRTLDPAEPRHAAMLNASSRIFRGSGYVAFDGETPAQPMHSALNAEYAHVTAPLRRLGDRYAAEICLALCAGEDIPEWVRTALPGLPSTLQSAAGRAGRYERMVFDLVEAGLLRHRVGETFGAVVVEIDDDEPRKGTVAIADPAIEAPVISTAPIPLGSDVQVRLTHADLETRKVEFTLDQ